MKPATANPLLPRIEDVLQTDPLIIEQGAAVKDVIAQMNRQGATSALIRADGQIGSFLTISDIVRLITAGRAHVTLPASDTPGRAAVSIALSEATNVLEALRLLSQHQTGCLIARHVDGSLAGVITQESICATITPAMLVRMRAVAEVMARDLIVCPPATPLRTIAGLMEQHQISSVVIAIDDEGGQRPLGLITDRDITRAHIAGIDLEAVPAGTHLTQQPVSISAEASLWDAHHAMDRAHVRRLLVIDGQGYLVGLLTQSALLSADAPQDLQRTLDLIQRSISAPASGPLTTRPPASDQGVARSGIRLLLVDDNGLFLQVLQRLLLSRGFTVVGAASSGHEAIEHARRIQPDIILMDVEMPDISGIDAMKAILDERPDARVVILTVAEDDETLFDAVRLGAAGYLLKDVDIDQLSTYIVGLMRGEAALSPILAQRVLSALASQMRQDSAIQPDPSSMLTHHQIRILTLLAQGNTYKEIGRVLGYSERAIKYHTGEAIRQLHLKDRAEAIAYARAHMQRGSWPQVGDP